MDFYAFLDGNGIVTHVIPGVDASEQIEGMAAADWYANFQGQPCVLIAGTSGSGFAGPGYRYDAESNALVAPQPFPSWTLDADYQWQPPSPFPSDENKHYWDEDALSWVEVEPLT